MKCEVAEMSEIVDCRQRPALADFHTLVILYLETFTTNDPITPALSLPKHETLGQEKEHEI